MIMNQNEEAEANAILEARHNDPFSFLGLHPSAAGWTLRIFNPLASEVFLLTAGGWEPLERVHPEGIHAWEAKEPPPFPCRIRCKIRGVDRETFDPYSFGNTLSGQDLYLFGEGRLLEAYRMLGAQVMEIDKVPGVRFALWAPNAERVSVIGDFNGWDGRVHPMRMHDSSGVWDIFIPELDENAFYKFEIRQSGSGRILTKTDPYGFSFELRPGTAAKVTRLDAYSWGDESWLKARASRDWLDAPMILYELHAGSWRRDPYGQFLNYRELVEALIPYVLDMGYTHIQLMPICEHPLDESWGYQTTGYYGVTSRYGSPSDFKYFVDSCHRAGIGVILDWVPAHFPRDNFALARFDGTALYEHQDPRLGEHQDWGTYIFNYGRNEVGNFLLANAHFWLSEYHIDGLRVDAVASMLYLDYSRKKGEWIPNRHGGRENLEAIRFLKELNIMVHEAFPGALTIAEESTSWPMVSRPVYLGGLGFSMKWNMGWMNDTIRYMEQDPIHRRHHHNELTFGQLYNYTENFILPFSHDEVVHGKRSLLDKMPGDSWQKFANLRLLFTYQMSYPGKKLNFMGNEFAQGLEWQVGAELDWWLLEREQHRKMLTLTRDLNRLCLKKKPLHELDVAQEGFRWIDCHDSEQSVISFRRIARDGSYLIVALNFTPVPRYGYRIGVPEPGFYREIFNSDSSHYGGSNLGNGAGIAFDSIAWMGEGYSLVLTLPPLAGIIIEKGLSPIL